MRILIAIAIMAALLFWGSDDASRDEMVVRGAIIAFVGLAFPLTYVWKFICEPAQMDARTREDYQNEIVQLKERLAHLENKPRQREKKFIEKTKREIADKTSEIREFVLFKNWNEDSIREAFHGASPLINRISYHDPEFSRIWEEFRKSVDTYAAFVLKRAEMPGIVEFAKTVASEKVDEATGAVLEYLKR